MEKRRDEPSRQPPPSRPPATPPPASARDDEEDAPHRPRDEADLDLRLDTLRQENDESGGH